MGDSKTIKFFFINEQVKPNLEEEVQSTYILAYKAVMDDRRSGKNEPKKILIRSGAHDTMTVNGRYVPDPDGNHWTIGWKGVLEVTNDDKRHYTLHAYTPDREDFTLKKTSLSAKKPDWVQRPNGGECYPPEDELHFGAEIEVTELEKY